MRKGVGKCTTKNERYREEKRKKKKTTAREWEKEREEETNWAEKIDARNKWNARTDAVYYCFEHLRLSRI